MGIGACLVHYTPISKIININYVKEMLFFDTLKSYFIYLNTPFYNTVYIRSFILRLQHIKTS